MDKSQVSGTSRLQQVDVPGVAEVFADRVHEVMYDGQTFRLELGVTRMEAAAGGGAAGKSYTASRLVLPASAALELSQRLSRVFAAMLKHDAERKAAQRAAPAAASPAAPAAAPTAENPA